MYFKKFIHRLYLNPDRGMIEICSQSSLVRDSLFVNSPTHYNSFVTPKSTLVAPVWSFVDLCRVTQKFEFSAEAAQATWPLVSALSL